MSESPEGAGSPRFYPIAWAFYLLLALAGVAWLGWRGDLRLDAFVSPARWPLELAAGLAAGGVLIGGWQLCRRRLRAARDLEQRLATVMGDVTRDEIFALAMISGIAEELFFRGGVQGSWGWVWATALFAVLHTGPGREYRLWTLFAALAGLLFAALYAWSGSLLAPIVAHVVVNGVNLRLLRSRAGG